MRNRRPQESGLRAQGWSREQEGSLRAESRISGKDGEYVVTAISRAKSLIKKFVQRTISRRIIRDWRRYSLCRFAGMRPIHSFRDLLVWQKSVDLAVRCHHVAKRFPRDEQPVLGYQVRKSGLSIPSNVAEGFSRHSTAFYVQHLWTAHASGAELETQLTVGTRIGVISESDAEALIRDAAEGGRMINGLVASLERAR